MYERLKSLYLKGSLTDSGLDRAVQKGWITISQGEEIKSLKDGEQA